MPPFLAANTREPGRHNLRKLRDFDSDQLDSYNRSKAEYQRLRERLSLLQVVAGNYQQILTFMCTIPRIGSADYGPLIEINRLLMNYMSSAYALREHLETATKRDFGRASKQVGDLNAFLMRLEQSSFPYAFFQDFRNYVQHCGFPVGGFTAHKNMVRAEVHITYDPQKLLSQYKDWGKSKLGEYTEPVIDITTLVQDHHSIVIAEFPAAILGLYGSRILEIDSYFRALHAEAYQHDATAIAVLVKHFQKNEAGMSFTLDHIPRDPIGELGVVLHPKQEK